VPAVQTFPQTIACVKTHNKARRNHDLSKRTKRKSGRSAQGARGEATILAEGLFEGEAQDIIRAAIDLIIHSDTTLCNLNLQCIGELITM
jgi:hypothetical protein